MFALTGIYVRHVLTVSFKNIKTTNNLGKSDGGQG